MAGQVTCRGMPCHMSHSRGSNPAQAQQQDGLPAGRNNESYLDSRVLCVGVKIYMGMPFQQPVSCIAHAALEAGEWQGIDVRAKKATIPRRCLLRKMIFFVNSCSVATGIKLCRGDPRAARERVRRA